MPDAKKPRPIDFGPKNNSKIKFDTPSREVAKKVDEATPAPPKAATFPAQVTTTTPKQITLPRAAAFSPVRSTSETNLEAQTGRNIITPEEAKFNLMVAKGVAIDPDVGGRPGFVKHLKALVALPVRDVINWGAKSLETNKAVTDRLAAITRDLSFQEVARWVDEAQTESTKPPSKGLFDRFKQKAQSPEFYEHKLSQIRDTLDRIISPKIDQAIKQIDDIPDVFAMEVLALKVWSEGLTDAAAMQIADNRYRILIQAQQGIMMTKQALANLQVSVAQSIQQIDELVLTVIPKWKIAFSHQTRN